MRTTRFIPLLALFGLAIGRGTMGQEVSRLWNSTDRGQVIFIWGGKEGLQFQDSRVCALKLPSRTVTLLATADSVRPGSGFLGAVWERGCRSFYTTGTTANGGSGLFRVDLDHGSTNRILTCGEWKHRGAPDKGVFLPAEEGGQRYHEPPGVRVEVGPYDVSRRSGMCYALIDFEIFRGVPGWGVSADSMVLPAWVEKRVRAQILSSTHEWSDIISIDTLGAVSFVTELPQDIYMKSSVSPDERFFAFLGMTGLHIYDRRTRTVLTPSLPPGARVGPCSFSPDGQLLGAIGSDSLLVSVYVAHTPGLEAFEVLHGIRIPARRFMDLCWSPDGDWILLQYVAPGSRYSVYDLAVLEVASGRTVDIPRPYLVDGREAPEISVRGRTDWTK